MKNKTASVQKKFILPIIIVAIIILVISFLVFKSIQKNQINTLLETTAKELTLKNQLSLDKKSDVWLTNALQMAINETIVNGLAAQDREIIHSFIGNINKTFKDNTSFKNVNVHVINKDLVSFFKSWAPDNYGESLIYSDVYKTVLQTDKPVVSIEESPKGLRLKGVYPVKKDETVLGMINFEGGINSMAKAFKEEHIDFLYFLSPEYKQFFKKDKKIKDGYMLSSKSYIDKNFLNYVMSEEYDLSKGIQDGYTFDNQYFTAPVILKDFKGHEIGCALLAYQAEFINNLIKTSAQLIKFSNYFLIGTVLIILLIVYISLKIYIIKPLAGAVVFAQNVAQKDLTQKIDINRKDEIGNLINSLNMMAKNLQMMFAEIITGAQTLTASSTELSAISEQMSAHSGQTSEKANHVSASAEEMSVNMNNVAAATEQAASNIDMVVAAAEEMAATINEIAGNTSISNETTHKAVKATEEVAQKVDKLGKSTSEISQVTETIAAISEQTNLLALNATIEAARAGEAGKGFAVVANEIKALAQQTAEATQEISGKIGAVQATTTESVSAINAIVLIINEINEIVATVAAAVEEQSTTTKEIANNVSQAALGVQEINKNASQTSAVAAQVTSDITEVSQAAGKMNNESRQVKTSAAALSKLAEHLNKMMGEFKI
ncbi:methyl-accepting chemotaxis protein [Desulfobacter latus]|uniref:Methyl-accepting chemotaxis protein n=1 Tax=Desulfobacter latus TaxID=2292 RepID=A0A850T5Z2_9BACT|nr:methyl-accepting chemotaxis protein [Desulfobacter latus]NWH04752.1 methyl-accepting chemotaxis protein [Desulfobacter latus]